MIPLDITTFFGRFHPVFVHLPIGFLLLVIIIEWYQSRKNEVQKDKFVIYGWLLGAISAILAAFCGWLLAETGDYAQKDIFWHRWLGVLLAIVASFGWWIKSRPNQFSILVNKIVSILVVGLLLIEGHLGGNLTHGSDYILEYSPKFVQNLFLNNEQDNTLPKLIDKDSVVVYHDMIYPILDAKCVRCHNDAEQLGGLNLEQTDLFIKGGENGPVISSGDIRESELFIRITLPQKNEKYMPPKGESLTYDEIKVIEWWIENGGDFENKLSEYEVSESMQEIILRLYDLDTKAKPWYESVKIMPADSLQINELREMGFRIKTISEHNFLLDVKFSGEKLTKENLMKLENVKDHITWLSFAKSDIQDDWLSTVGKFSNLTRLQLEKTAITEVGLAYLKELKHLEALNIYGTNVSDAAVVHLEDIQSLKRLYIWNTNISSAGADKLRQSIEQLEIIGSGRLPDQ